MSIIFKKWIELREFSDSENSEISYVRLQDIERISFTDNSPHDIRIFISALGEKYLYDAVETLQEAQMAAKEIIQDIENSRSHIL